MKILVTGATGFLGRHLLPLLVVKYGNENVIGVSSKDYDLMDRTQVSKMFKEIQPDIVYHLAAYSGGIEANRTKPADFYYINTILTANVFDEAAKQGISKLIYTMGGCSYPATAISPINEEQMWQGYPQEQSAGYSAAKKMGIVASRSYRTQYGLNSVVVIPGNMYGEYDNFRNGESHVIPGMIRRYYEAKINNLEEVVMWGTGSPQRDFVYAGDVAKALLYFADNYDSSEPVNISTGTTITMKELAEKIKEFLEYNGAIAWDSDKPDGQLVKIFDVSRMKQIGIECKTPFEEGLKKTIEWLVNNYQYKSDGIRL